MPHACTNCGRTFPDGSKEMLSGCPDCGGNKFRYHPDGVAETPDTSGDSGRSRSPPDPDDEGLPARDQGVVDRATTTVREWVNQRSRSPSPPAHDTGGSHADDAAPAGPADDPTAAGSADGPGTTGPNGTADTAAPGDGPTGEDTAQADARGGLADPDEIAEGTPETPQATEDGTARATSDPDPGLDAADAPGATDTPGDTGETRPVGESRERATAQAQDGERAAQPQTATAPGESAQPAEPSATPSASNLAQLREELNEQFESIRIVEPGQYELNLMGLYDREEYIISLMEDGRYAIEVPETWRDADDGDGD